MQILATASPYISIPVTGPAGVDITAYPVYVAIVAEDHGEPATGEYKAAAWVNGEAVLKINAGDYPAGQYLMYVRVVTGGEDVRLYSGRLRVGDARV